jgi:hypothetical protein
MEQRDRPTELELASSVAPRLQPLLPAGWTADADTSASPDTGIDMVVRVTAPDGRTGNLLVQAKSLISPKDAAVIAAVLAPWTSGRAVGVAVARYLSPSARDALQRAGLSYLDWTGNTRLALSEPGLVIQTPGSNRDPFRTPERPMQTLKGRPAARVVRALIDRRPPWRMRELAGEAQTSLGSTARTVDFLDREALVERERGTVVAVDWPRLLRRWAEEHDFASHARLTRVLLPRGLDALEESLREWSVDECVISGSLAARRLSAYADARLALLYVTDTHRVVSRLEGRETTVRPNVLVLEPADDLPFARSELRDGLRYAAPSQLFADLMSGPGRSPAEAEAVGEWMQQHENEWRRG